MHIRECDTVSRFPSFWTLQLLGWSACFVAMAFSRIGRLPLSYMFAEKVVLTLLGVAVSLVHARGRAGSVERIVIRDRGRVVALELSATDWRREQLAERFGASW